MVEIYTFFFRQIGRKVAYYRRLRNMTQEELANRINVSISTVGKIERGKYNNNLSLSILKSIADGLNIDLSLLVTFDDREKGMEWDELNAKGPRSANSSLDHETDKKD